VALAAMRFWPELSRSLPVDEHTRNSSLPLSCQLRDPQSEAGAGPLQFAPADKNSVHLQGNIALKPPVRSDNGSDSQREKIPNPEVGQQKVGREQAGQTLN